MSIYGGVLYYDQGINTLQANANLNVSGPITQKTYSISSYNSATQSIASGATTTLTYNNDTLNNWPTRSSATTFSPPISGTYLIIARAYYGTPPASGTCRLIIFKNSTIVAENITAGNSILYSYETQAEIPLVTTDVVTIGLSQSSGSPVLSGGLTDTSYNGNNVSIDRLHS
jgi:hypothetical protein